MYTDDPDQLPALPDPGPRDGRHGVDRDDAYDPYPAQHMGVETAGGPLTVSIADAKWHLPVLIARVEAGEEIVLTRHGHPVARIVAHQPQATVSFAQTVVDAVSVVDGTVIETRTVVYTDDADQLPELPDPGPRDGRHGVDRETGYAASGG